MTLLHIVSRKLLIHILETSGVSIQVMIMLTALWIVLKMSHIRDCSMIHLSRLEYDIREELNKTAPRMMIVLHPIKVVITNPEADITTDLKASKWPDAQTDDASVFYKVPFSNVVYIDHADFRLEDSKDFYGLAPSKSVLLRYAFPIKRTDVILADDEETVLEIRAAYDPKKKTKRKNPAELDNWLADLNPESKVVIPNAYAVPSLENAGVGDTFQFERLGYFVVDKDSTPEKLVFNITVTLRDSYKQGGSSRLP